MKTTLLFVFTFFTIHVFCQTIDSTAIKQVDSLIQVSRALTGKRDFDKALQVNAEAEKLALSQAHGMGKESAAYGSCCFNRGRVNYFKGDITEAEKWYLESKAIREKVLGKEHPDYAGSLNSLGYLYSNMGAYEKAEPLYLESKAIREKVLGKEHPDYAWSLINLGNLYFQMGAYEKAESFYLESKAIQEKVLGKEHPDYARSLSNLGVSYLKMGAYEKAEPLYLESRAIQEKVLGKEHPDYARSLLNLGNLYYQMGAYEKAEPLFLESKAIHEKVLGKEHPDYALILNSLGNLYFYMGAYEKAEPLFLESKAIQEKVLGKEHPDYAPILNNLGFIYSVMGAYEKAEPLLLESKAVREKVLGKEHPDYAWSLNSLGNLYSQMGAYEKAEPLYREAKAIREKVLGKEHPDYAGSLNSLGNLYFYTGVYEKAEPLYLESKAIREKVLGKEHPDYVGILNNLEFLYEFQNKHVESETLAKEYFERNQSGLIRSTTFLSERELASYVATFQREGNLLSSQLLARNGKNTPTGIFPALAFDQALFQKGFLLTAANRLNTLAAASPEAEALLNELKSYRRRLAKELAKPLAAQSGVAALEEKANVAEKALARSVVGYAEAARQVKWQEVQSALQPGEAALEFIDFKVTFPKTTDSTMYAALLLLPGKQEPKFLPLFEQKQLDSLLQTQGARKADYVNSLYTIASRGVKPVGKPQKLLYELLSLYELLWKPLEKELAGTKTIYFSPDGLLHRLNLGAIPISEEKTLADRYRLVELGSTRQVVVPSMVKNEANDAVLFGGVQYDMDSTAFTQANQGLENDKGIANSRGGLSFANADAKLRGGSWTYLKWTDKEVTALEPILKNAGVQISIRKGYAATEEYFKTLGQGKPSPRILHLATHGFFFPDPNEAHSAGRGLGEDEPAFKMSDHPMIRSGLILAGGNKAWSGNLGSNPFKPDLEDGILTAYEISQMNLSNTELVVLSACETGLGEIQGNEGVYGLQRAFKIAGAKYLVMSLWQVPDQETSVFMTTFYQHFITDKMSIPDAFRRTQQEMRQRFINPYLWAGFVLVE